MCSQWKVLFWQSKLDINEISLPFLESPQIHLHRFRLAKMLLLLLFSLNISQHLMIIFQVDLLSSAKAYGKKTVLMSPGKSSSGKRPPKIQDPGSGEQDHVGPTEGATTSHPLHSPSKSAPISTLPSSLQALCEIQCPNGLSRLVHAAPAPHGQAAGSPSEAIPAR